jgi:CheY-like chemotaxis protein
MAPPLAILVDDNLMFTMNMEAALRRLGFGVRTLAASGGTAGAIAAGQPALVLISLAALAPALELIRDLRARPELAGLRILAYAGHVQTAALHAAKDAGADQAIANSAVLGHLERVVGSLDPPGGGSEGCG